MDVVGGYVHHHHPEIHRCGGKPHYNVGGGTTTWWWPDASAWWTPLENQHLGYRLDAIRAPFHILVKVTWKLPHTPHF
jgi:hypothetical protein